MGCELPDRKGEERPDIFLTILNVRAGTGIAALSPITSCHYMLGHPEKTRMKSNAFLKLTAASLLAFVGACDTSSSGSTDSTKAAAPAARLGYAAAPFGIHHLHAHCGHDEPDAKRASDAAIADRCGESDGPDFLGADIRLARFTYRERERCRCSQLHRHQLRSV